MKRFILIHSLILCVWYFEVPAQTAEIDTTINSQAPSSILSDTVITNSDTIYSAEYTENDGTFTIPISSDTLDAKVIYTAEDSIIYDIVNGKVYLYGNAVTTYKEIKLKADFIIYNWNTNTLTADVLRDSLGNPLKYAFFEEGGSVYRAHKMRYNFKTKKAKIYEARIQEQDGYIHLSQGKKNEKDEWFGFSGKYTTCSLDEPHFHIQTNKLKIVPDKVMVSGPAYMKIEGIPTPLVIPFGIFPIKKGQRSGIIMPEYGEDLSRGFFFKNGGYYLGFSEYFDLRLTADIYTNGSFAFRGDTRYKKRYKYNGNVNLSFGRNKMGEPEDPDFAKTNDFRVSWRHTQDSKARPGTRFSANVNFGTASYDRNFSTTQSRLINNNLSSRISYSKTLTKNINFSLNATHDQNLQTGKINLKLPDITFGVSNVTPFKSKVSRNKPRFYEKLSIGYTLRTAYQLSGVDSTFFEKETFTDAKFGVQHTVPIRMPMRVFKFFNFTPVANYNEKWYAKTTQKVWNPEYIYSNPDSDGIYQDTIKGQLETNMVTGFEAARQFNVGANLSTILYGQLNFKGKFKAIRHVITPTVGFSYQPDFSKDFWGYYKTVQTNENGETTRYSIFENTLYGGPGVGERASINFSINNNLQIKTYSKKDTVKHENKITLVDFFSIVGSYNFVADSLKMSRISMRYNNTFMKKVTVQATIILDPYITDENNRRINTTKWEADKRVFRLTDASFSLSVPINPKTKTGINENVGTQAERDLIYQNPYLFYDFNVIWSVNINYNLRLTRGVTANPDTFLLSANGFFVNMDFNLTPKWKVRVNSGYDFIQKTIASTDMSVIRDLHCWQMSFNYRPFPRERQFYSMQINVKSPILQELKLTRKNDARFSDTAF